MENILFNITKMIPMTNVRTQIDRESNYQSIYVVTYFHIFIRDKVMTLNPVQNGAPWWIITIPPLLSCLDL